MEQRFLYLFLKGRTVMYLDCCMDAAHRHIGEMSEELSDRFKDIGYRFVFLPKLANRLDSSILRYMFPGIREIMPVQGMYHRIHLLAGINGERGFLYRQDRIIQFFPIPDGPDGSIDAEIDRFIDILDESAELKAESIRFSREARKESTVNFELNSSAELALPESEPNLFDLATDEIRPSIVGADDSPDPRTQRIIQAWEAIEREFGITIQDLDIILGYRVKLSRMQITPAGKIFLTDWDGTPEVKMDDLTKALYFFYLRHPEGVPLKELHDYESEVLGYYSRITGRDDKEVIKNSVHKLLDPYGNGVNVSISRIKKAFRDVVGDRVAKFYYVDGIYAEPRKIAIDRDYVIWDH